MPWSNKDQAPQLESPRATTSEPSNSRALELQLEKALHTKIKKKKSVKIVLFWLTCH